MDNLEIIVCDNCTALTNLSVMKKLKQLYCQGCTSLTSIPEMAELIKLYCQGCTSLTSISVMVNLELLCCEYCTSLTNIPLLSNLQKLFCQGCTSLTNIPIIPELKYINCNECKWIRQCDEYEENIKSLRSCQAIFKRKLTARKLEKLLPFITEIYYSPGCKGAYLAYRAFMEKEKSFINEIK
jgi:hypothetical protein